MIDLTYRQFVEETPWPRLLTEAEFAQEWGNVDRVEYGSPDWLARRVCMDTVDQAGLHPEL